MRRRSRRAPRRACRSCTIGPTSCSWNSNSVTTPKLPPPPRTAQNRSGFSSAAARRILPSAVTTWTDKTLSRLSPCRRVNQPIPPPRVRPADAGVADHPGRSGQAVRLGRRVQLGELGAAADPSTSRLRIDRRPGSSRRGRSPARRRPRKHPHMLCAPPRTAISRPFRTPNRIAARTSSALTHRATTAGRRSISAFHTLRASSYSASSGATTVPSIAV